jgi:phosphate-selective porin OprO/OprP
MTRSAKTLLAASVASLLCAPASQALAQAIPTAPTVGGGISQEQALALTARLDALERRNDELEREVHDLKAQTGAADAAIRKDLGATKVSLANGRPAFASADGRFTAALRGVFQLDAARYEQDTPGPLATDFRRGSLGDAGEADHARDMADGTTFRRARLGIEGKAFGDWDYSFLYEFGGSGVEGGGVINQAWLQYSGLGAAKLRIGAFSPPAGMDDATSTNGSVFLERSAISELVRGMAAADGRTGAGVLASGKRWNLSAIVTGNTVGQSSFDEQLGFVGRAAFVPWQGEHFLVHLAADTSVIVHPAASGPDTPPGAVTPVRLRERPESRVEGVRLVDTGAIDAHRAVAWGLEAAAQYRAFTVQSEYFHIGVDRRASALSNPHFSGWYVQGAWTLTGQPRRYAMSSATFDAPKVDKPFNLKTRDWGVWELAARYSDLDLNDQAGALGAAPGASAVRGGDQQIVTLGLNWYPNAVVRFQANFQDVDVDRLSPGGTAFGAGALTPPAGAQVGQKLQIWSFRTQYAF